jgi:hypothetical protein
MLKTYRIIPLVFILFLFGFTLFTVAPVFAQTLDQLIERVEKLEAFHAGQTVPPVVEQPTLTPVPSKIDGPWDKSMGMRHPDRPCMKVNACGPDKRSAKEIASDPYDTLQICWTGSKKSTGPADGRGQCIATDAQSDGASMGSGYTEGWDESEGMRHPDRPCMNRANYPGGCGPDRRSPEQKASDPYDTNNPASQAGRARDCRRGSMEILQTRSWWRSGYCQEHHKKR